MTLTFTRPAPLVAIAWALLGFIGLTLIGVAAWIVFFAIVIPPPEPQCRLVHAGEILISSVHFTDGSVRCEYIDESQIYGRARIVRPGQPIHPR